MNQNRSEKIRFVVEGDGKGGDGCANLQGNHPDPDHEGKILICHVPPGNPNNPQTLSINPNALFNHQGHCDDTDGPCETVPDDSPPGSNGGSGGNGECEFGVPDCAGVCNGKATYDCMGICQGPHELDCAGNCFNPTSEEPPAVKDCSGECNGSAVPDCLGVCGGSAAPDCKGRCGGSATYDCLGECYDPETEEPQNVRDCNNECNGGAYRDCSGKCISDDCVWDGKPVAHNPNKAQSEYKAKSGRPKFSPKNL